MEYQATFGIDGGVSTGFGVKYPDYYQETKKIFADSYENAMRNAVDLARELSRDHLSNPNTGYTTVRLLILAEDSGKPLDQEPLNEDPNIIFENRQAIVKCSTMEHFLDL